MSNGIVLCYVHDYGRRVKLRRTGQFGSYLLDLRNTDRGNCHAASVETVSTKYLPNAVISALMVVVP
jgi:hypothetical protein